MNNCNGNAILLPQFTHSGQIVRRL